MLTVTEDPCGASAKQRVHSLIEHIPNSYDVVGPVPGAGLAALNQTGMIPTVSWNFHSSREDRQ